jgi:cytochrome c556
MRTRLGASGIVGVITIAVAGLLAQDKPVFPPELTKLMEEVQVLFKSLQEAARFSKAKFESDAKHEELARAANRLAELMKQTEKFSPEKDAPDKPKKDWLDTCQASAQHARELAEAAKKKDYSAYRGAFKRMDAACTRCHEIFR